MRALAVLVVLVLLGAGACDSAYSEDPRAADPVPDAAAEPSVDAGVEASVELDASTPPTSPETDAAVEAASPCGAGFVLSGGLCLLANPFVDPGFSGAPLGAWTLGNEATLLATEQGAVDVGIARLADESGLVAYRHGTVAQTMTLPPFDATGPLALDVHFTSTATFSIGSAVTPFIDGVALLDGHQNVTSPGTQSSVVSVCLGELAHGGPRAFLFSTGAYFERVDVDRVAIAQTSACPRPGVIMNGDFESGGGWTFHLTNKVGITAGAGTNGSRAAKFLATPTSSAGRFSQDVSIPKSGVNALTLRTYGSANVRLTLDGRDFARLVSSPTRSVQRVCLPRWTHGIVVNLGFALGHSASLTADELDDEVAIDDVALAFDAACADDDAVRNLGFETEGDPIPGWLTTESEGNSATRQTGDARTGSGFLSLRRTTAACGGPFRAQPRAGWVGPRPASTTAGGASIHYWYRYASDATSTARLVVDDVVEPLAPAADWTMGVRCLEPLAGGSRVGLSFELFGGSPCGAGASLDVDDVELVADPTCPSR